MKLIRIGKVSERALVGRINRKLWKDQEILRRCAERSRGFQTLCRYYIVDSHSGIIDMDVDLENLGRKMGALQQTEALAG